MILIKNYYLNNQIYKLNKQNNKQNYKINNNNNHQINKN